MELLRSQFLQKRNLLRDMTRYDHRTFLPKLAEKIGLAILQSLGLSIAQAAAINAVVPVLFIFTPPLAGFLAERLGNFR